MNRVEQHAFDGGEALHWGSPASATPARKLSEIVRAATAMLSRHCARTLLAARRQLLCKRISDELAAQDDVILSDIGIRRDNICTVARNLAARAYIRA